jgi:hypothetical protein
MSIEDRLTALENEMARMREGTELPRLANAVKELEDAMTVVTYLHARLASNYKGAVEWLESHTKAMTEIREAQRATDVRIDALVSATGELLRARFPLEDPHAG